MKVPKTIIDTNPSEPIYEFDVITFKKTDSSRGAVKGAVGAVVDLINYEKYGYTIETGDGETNLFMRHEFRLATPEDISRHRVSREAKETVKSFKPHSISPPEMPVEMNKPT